MGRMKDGEELGPRAAYPMRVVARLTGVAPDTIRAWERRYGAIAPGRTDGNTRLFSAQDVRRLTLLREVTASGHAIGQVASLPDEALARLASGAPPRGTEAGSAREGATLGAVVEQVLGAVARFEARRAEELLARAAVVLSPRTFALEVALPLLQETGERWAQAEIGVAQEHLVSGLLRGMLGTVARIYPPDPGSRRVVVSTPAGHRHEFGILIGALLAASRGLEVIYLGVDLPCHELQWAVETSQAAILLLGVSMPLASEQDEALRKLADALPARCQLWLGGPPGAAPQHPRIAPFQDFAAFDVALADLGR